MGGQHRAHPALLLATAKKPPLFQALSFGACLINEGLLFPNCLKSCLFYLPLDSSDSGLIVNCQR